MLSPSPSFRWVLSVLLVFCAMAACQGLQPQPPSAREALATGYATVELAANAAVRLHQSGLIDDGERLSVKNRLSAALVALDAGKALVQASDEDQGRRVVQAALQAALTVLTELQTIEGRAAP